MTNKPYTSLKEIEKECKKIKSSAVGTDRFMALCFPFLIEQLRDSHNLIYQMASDIKYLRTHLKSKKKNPSEYNLHIAFEISSGKTFQEAIKSWKEREVPNSSQG